MPRLRLPAPVAIIDVETTGLFPLRNDRVVELAAVVIGDEGQMVREFSSLVNPGRDVGPTRIHGLTAEDVRHAPEFSDIASAFVETLHGTVALAGHNVRFDHQFIECEFARIGIPVPECFTLCTMQLAGGGRLTQCCCEYGIARRDQAHHALADARAAAQLLLMLLADQPRVVQTLSRLTPIQWPALGRTGKQPITRDEVRNRQAQPPSFLQRLLDRMHVNAEPIATDGALLAYIGLLDRVLEDRHIDEAEGDALVEMATKWGLSGEQINFAHREYLHQLALAAASDRLITDVERRDLMRVMRLLGQHKLDLEQLLREAAAELSRGWPAAVAVPAPRADLRGMRVCFTGELQSRYQGELISRELAEELATKAGLIVMDSVTKKLDLLVVADPHTQSGKAKKAREYGIRIMHEPVFWRAIGVSVE